MRAALGLLAAIAAGCPGPSPRPVAAPLSGRADPLLRMLPAPPADVGLKPVGKLAVYRGAGLYDYLGTRAGRLYGEGLEEVARLLYDHPRAGRVRVEVYRFRKAGAARAARQGFGASGGRQRLYLSGRFLARAAARRLDKGGRAGDLLDDLIEMLKTRVDAVLAGKG